MSRCPLAAWKPLGDDPTHQPLMSKYDLVIIHTMVGTLAGTDAMFRAQGYVGVESHFGTGYVGGKCVAYQWCDTARTADANLDGNPRAISIENADTASPYPAWKGSEVPPFTDDQCELIAQITAWACKTHGIPAKLAPDSRPTSRGIAWHRQGRRTEPARPGSEGQPRQQATHGRPDARHRLARGCVPRALPTQQVGAIMDRFKAMLGEPVAIIAALTTIVAFAITFTDWSADTQGKVMALVLVVAGGWGAWQTENGMLTFIVGVFKAAIVLGAVWGLALTEDQQALGIALLTAVVSLWYLRDRNAPKSRAVE
jgi:hypothetical protein